MTKWRAQHRALTLIGLIFALGVGFLPLAHWGDTHVLPGNHWGGEILWWAAVLVLLLYVLAAEHRSLSSIGFRTPRGSDLGWGLIFGIALFVGAGILDGIVFPALHLKIDLATYRSIIGAPIAYRVALVTRAAVCEEILFRGYSIERLKEWTGSAWLAGLISLAVFTFAHLTSWGAPQLIVAAYGGAVLTVLYLWRGNIWANMLAHWIGDCSFIFLPLLTVHH
ncbi:MAG: type II CAAX endopeptidase family protein [Steroidobacteraceae bacterium]